MSLRKLLKNKKIIVAGSTKRNVRKFFNKLKPSFVKDNKLFWKTIEPFSSDEGNCGTNIKLEEKR